MRTTLHRRGVIIVAAACAALSPVAAHATTATASIAISATVLSFCNISATALGFGNYSSVQLSATTSVTVSCTVGTSYNVGLDPGTGSGATVSVRKMTLNSGSATLNYSLYSDSGYSVVWGNTIGTNTVTGTGTGANQTLTVYGRIPAAQLVTPGGYSDSVVATITY